MKQPCENDLSELMTKTFSTITVIHAKEKLTLLIPKGIQHGFEH